ncbi:hypothetical protein J2Z31_003368 [Sinorhizobium kostiense]|uniref:DUF4432 domain-containing protein n=1 Tax=Sinorhizobium kostiense TaxID=76747 RepID=A0ABS4R2E2_9HYPH|nr:hypothetical protein [Sinorhizobium kostiense]
MKTRLDADDRADGYLLFDRSSALDIAAFVVTGVDLSPGEAIPPNGDRRIDRALAGFLFTCGPDHIRHPEPVDGGGDGACYPLHGSLSGTPVSRAEISQNGFRCTGITEVDLACGGRAAIERCWQVEPDCVRLQDRVLNIGATGFAPMMMYHINIGGRLLGAETRIEALSVEGGSQPWRFGEGESAHFCIPAVASQDGWGRSRLARCRGSKAAAYMSDSGRTRCRSCRCGVASAAAPTSSASSRPRTGSPNGRSTAQAANSPAWNPASREIMASRFA